MLHPVLHLRGSMQVFMMSLMSKTILRKRRHQALGSWTSSPSRGMRWGGIGAASSDDGWETLCRPWCSNLTWRNRGSANPWCTWSTRCMRRVPGASRSSQPRALRTAGRMGGTRLLPPKRAWTACSAHTLGRDSALTWSSRPSTGAVSFCAPPAAPRSSCGPIAGSMRGDGLTARLPGVPWQRGVPSINRSW